MSEQKIVPDRIIKPIQLLAAWLAGLIIVNGSFLGAAVAIEQPDWLRMALVLACIANVPLFLYCLFLLQTKFRPQMQEDLYYAKYLEQNTGQLISTNPTDTAIQQLRSEVAESNQRYVDMISGLDEDLKALAILISSTVTNHKVDEVARSELIEIVREVTKSAQVLELAKERAADANAFVQLNDMLPDFEAIRRELWKENIAIAHIFGSTATEPEIPKFRVIGFGKAVSIETLRRVVRVTSKFGFNRIHYARPELNTENIYIGSYIYRAPEEPQPVPLTSYILNLLNAPQTQLYELINAIESARA